MDRRVFLSGIVSVSVVGTAGCSGGNSGSNDTPSGPSSDANPKDLLPDAPEGWTSDDPSQLSAGMVGADAGFYQKFRDPDGNGYPVEILRISPSNDDVNVDDLVSVYSDWTSYVARNNFGFASKGPDVDSVYMLLGGSSVLTEEYARNNDMV